MYEERREKVLTDADLEALAILLRKQMPARYDDLTADEIGMVKRAFKWFNKAANIVGTVILVAFVSGLIAIFTKGFWMTLFEGVKR